MTNGHLWIMVGIITATAIFSEKMQNSACLLSGGTVVVGYFTDTCDKEAGAL